MFKEWVPSTDFRFPTICRSFDMMDIRRNSGRGAEIRVKVGPCGAKEDKANENEIFR